jgi:hypothetical protein
MFPWWTAAGLLAAPIAVADFDYRYLIPVIPFAATAAGLAFAPRTSGEAPSPGTAGTETAVPGAVA